MRTLERDVAADLRPEGGGAPVAMAPYESELGITRTAEGQVVALSTFSIPGPGTYVLQTDPIDGISPTESRIIVGKSLYAPLARGAILALVAIGISAVLSIVASIALAVTRGRAKRAAVTRAGAGRGAPARRPRGPGPRPSGPGRRPSSRPGRRATGPGRVGAVGRFLTMPVRLRSASGASTMREPDAEGRPAEQVAV